jgi:prepilin-type N-terminal cleavage/methylation domain-containing protein
MRRAFTLIELLVVITIVAVLIALVIPGVFKGVTYAHRTQALSNMRQIGIAAFAYLQDHNGDFPPRVMAANQDKWPALFALYLGNVELYVAPGDEDAEHTFRTDPERMTASDSNHTSFIINGLNEFGSLDSISNSVMNLTRIERPASVIFLGKSPPGNVHFYLDYEEHDYETCVDWDSYGKGSCFLFLDGSARWLTQADYHNEMWLVNAPATSATP